MKAKAFISLVLETSDQNGDKHIQYKESSQEYEGHKYDHNGTFIGFLCNTFINFISCMHRNNSWHFPIFKGLNLKESKHRLENVLVILRWNNPLLVSS